ncbi:hypothetical protein N7532_008823 [Penicillium argentinense]|uniref:Uncharacterized protein n=1 Tax=Penicillium argentinense TaxID=1131581 RepID=A0A9W9EY56_9EURO|nr:uncharacterized protein N7532_008823 [Penicillium argentinense]KAJ5090139.1 hypothetical protein N7532_008823 [Penicillium argentinense]
MFDLPTAKRVRRDEVQSPASSRSPSPADEAELQDAHDRLGKLLNLDSLLGTGYADTAGQETEQQPQAGGDEADEQEFEFRLFSAPSKPKDTDSAQQKSSKKEKGSSGNKNTADEGTHKLRIRMRSPTPISTNPEDGRFVKAFRGWQYYFTSPSLYELNDENSDEEARQLEKRRQFEEIAVSSEQLAWAKAMPWPGCDRPWRVIHLKRHQTKLPRTAKDVPVYVVEGAQTKSPKTKKKPGKKRRVQLRKKVKAAEVAKENEAEKRNRKNRERKIKRRQKAREEKAAKAAAAGVAIEDVTMADGDGSSGSEE